MSVSFKGTREGLCITLGEGGWHDLLNELALQRGQSLAQMAIAWVLRQPLVTSALVGASSVQQLENNITTLNNLHFDDDELRQIEAILTE